MQVKCKKYKMMGEENCLIQMIDQTKNIMYQDSRNKNQFLQMINATVSHEMRTPLNSIISQNTGTHYNHKQMKNIIKKMNREKERKVTERRATEGKEAQKTRIEMHSLAGKAMHHSTESATIAISTAIEPETAERKHKTRGEEIK